MKRATDVVCLLTGAFLLTWPAAALRAQSGDAVMKNIAVKKTATVIVARPVDAAGSKNEKIRWITALLQGYCHTRLAGVLEFSVPPVETLSMYLPSYGQFTKSISENEYLSAAKKLGASYVVYHKFELIEKGVSIFYYIEVHKMPEARVVFSTEKTFVVPAFGQEIDHCLITMLDQMKTGTSEQTRAFFKVGLVSTVDKELKDLGEALAEDYFTSQRDPEKLGKRYTALAAASPSAAIGKWMAGRAFAHAAKEKEAVAALGSFGTLAPVFGPVYIELCRLYRQNGKYGDAVTTAERAIKAGVSIEPVLVELLRSLVLLDRKDDAYAVAFSILQADQRNPDALLFVARWRNGEGRIAEGLDLVNRLLEIEPNNGAAHYEKARSLLAMNKPDEAVMPLMQATVLVPRDPEPHILLGKIYFDKKSHAKAAEQFAAALAGKPADLELALQTADAYELAGTRKTALETLKKFEAANPEDRRLNMRIGTLLFEMKDSAGARGYLEKCLNASVDNPKVFLYLAAVYAAAREYLKAVRMYEQAMPVVQEKNSCKIEIAKLFLKKGEPASAIPYLEQITAENKKFPDVYRYLGDAWRDADNAQKALEYYKMQRTQTGDNAYVQEQIARNFYDAGNLAEAKKEGLLLVKVDPKNAAAHYRLAVISLKEKDAKQSQAWLQKASGLGEGDEGTYYQLGDGYAQAGLLPQAESALRKCIAKNGGRVEAWVGLGDILLKMGKDSLAAETYMKVASFETEVSGEYAKKAGRLFEKIRCEPKAKDAYNFFLGRRNVDEEVSLRLGRLEYGSGNYGAVQQVLGARDLKDNLNDADNMLLAEAYFNDKKYKEALPLLVRAAGTETTRARALELAAMASEMIQEYRKAIDLYEAYLKLPASGNHRNFAFRSAQLYEKIGDKTGARIRYEQNIRDFADDIRNYKAFAVLCMEVGDWASAQKLLENAIAMPAVDAGIVRMLATTYEKLDLKEKAIEQYRAYLVKNPGDTAAMIGLGSLYFTTRDFPKAVEILGKAHAKAPGNFECAYLLGESYARSGRTADAVKALQAARDLDSKDMRAVRTLAECHRTLKDVKSLATVLREWHYLEPENLDVQSELGRKLLEINNTTEGIRILESVSKKRPEDVEIHQALARTYEATGDEKGRLAHLREALQHHPKNSQLHFELGKFYLAKRKPDLAEEHLRRAVENDPLLILARFELAQILQAAGKTPEAFEQYEKVMLQDPYNSRYLTRYSQSAYQMGRYEQALEAVLKAITQDSTNVEALGWAGFLYNEKGQTKQSKELLRKALVRDPNCAMCQEYMGEAYRYEADYQQAAVHYEKSLGLRTYSEEVSVKLAKAILISGFPEKAAMLIEKILAMNRQNDQAVYWLGHAYIRMGQPELAANLPQKFGFTQKTGWLHLLQGEIYELQNNIDAALISYSVAARLLPDEPLTLAATGRMNLVKNDYENAIINFGMALGKDPHNPRHLIELGKAYEGLSDYASASQIYAEVISNNPQFVEAFYLAARVMGSSGDHASAVKTLEEGARRSQQDPRFDMALGHEYRITGDYQKAIDAYERSVKKGGNGFVEAYRYIGSIHQEKLKDSKNAKKYFERYIKEGGQNDEVRKLLARLQ